MQSQRLPTIRELVAALSRRPGIDAVLLLSRDGIVIDGKARPGVDLDHLAAHVPSLITASDELSATAARGNLVSSVIEFERGFAAVCTLSADATLMVLLGPDANVGGLVAELRRHRSNMASLV
jgi:hypothetical protein